MTIREVLINIRERLQNAGIEDFEYESWAFLDWKLHIDRAEFYMNPNGEVKEELLAELESVLKQREQRVPLQYLMGECEFMGYDFYVDERVLIPRQDTEVLVEEAISRMRNLEKPQILDMCTGSGCILLSLLLELPQALGTGVDVSEGALCVAKENRKRLGLEQRAELIQSDLFSADYFRKNSGNDHMEYDMLISNPPYIRTEDIEGLMEEVRFHDPVLALDGKENGLYFYEKITEQAGTYLKPGGWLMYEIGCDQGMDVSEIMKKNGFEQIEIKKDLAGLDRVVTGRKMQEEQNV